VRKGGRRLVTAVDRAGRVLAAFTQSSDFLSLPEVAHRAGLSKPTTFRILTTLVAEGLVFQNEANSTYGLGFLSLRLADAVLGGIRLREPARAAMRRIRDAVNETVVLSIRNGDGYCNIDSLEGTHMIGQSQLIGVPMPYEMGAPGWVLLAGMPDDEVSRYLRRARFHSGNRGMSRRKLRREIAQIRRRGYATSAEDFTLGGHTIAAAIEDPQGVAVATLHISFPRGRYSRDLEDRCIKALIEGSAAISKSLRS
jgi:DNA-binding IclR family transcriptional regulator